MAWRRMIAGGGVLYTLDRDNNDILTAQFPDGSVATIGSGAGIAGTGMAYDDANDILYAMNSNGLYSFNRNRHLEPYRSYWYL